MTPSPNNPEITTHVVRSSPIAEAIGTIVFVHGTESHSGWFLKLSQILTEKGYRTVCYDRIGWGQSGGQRGWPEPLPALKRQLANFVNDSAAQYNQPVHVVGLSWGGLALLAAAQQGLLERATTIHALVPGLYARPRFNFWEKLKIFIGGLLKLPLMIDLPWLPEDFSGKAAVQSFIAADPFKTTRVKADFLWQTFLMQRTVKRGPEKLNKSALQFILATEDRIINNQETLAFVKAAGAVAKVIEQSAHSVVLDAPEKTAEAIASFAAGAK